MIGGYCGVNDLNVAAICRLSGKGVFAIMALANLRAFPRVEATGSRFPMVNLRPSGLCPFPLVVLWATANQEPPLFLIARS